LYKINLSQIPEKGINRRYRPGVSIRYLILEEFGAPGFEMRYFELEPGASSSEDVHACRQEVFVVRGRGTLLLEGRRFPCAPKMPSSSSPTNGTNSCRKGRNLSASFASCPPASAAANGR
jgi:hypothetical protein